MIANKQNEHTALARILVVDDEACIRNALVQALTFLGYEAEEAASGQQALAQIDRQSPDAMLLDMDLPDMSGVEVMQAARKLNQDLAIVILTGHGTLESAIAAVRYDAVEYLQKPASVEQIGETLAAAVAQRRREQRTQSLLQVIGQAVQQLEAPAAPAAAAEAPARLVRGGSLLLDRERRSVMLAGGSSATIALSEGEARTLEALMRRPGQLMSCRQLAAEALGYQVEEYEAECLVRPQIFRLRQRLEVLPGAADMIRTVRGRGYMFAPR